MKLERTTTFEAALGTPETLSREAAALLIAAATLYVQLRGSWWLFLLLLFRAGIIRLGSAKAAL